MRQTIPLALFGLLSACAGESAGPLGFAQRYEVAGVESDDMLKMRAGPGVGFVSVLGLPNGTVVDVRSCEPNGNTAWCNVSIGGPNGTEGYVSKAYLRKL